MSRRLPLCLIALLLTGCGGADDEQKLAPEGPGATVVAALGDSITAGSPLWDPDEDVRARIGSQADPESQFGYWAQLRLKGTSFRNCGVFGELTDEVAARLDDCAKGAKVLIVQGGINDIAQGRPVEEAARNLRGMVERGRELKLRVALVEVLPWNNGYPAAAGPIRQLNRSIAKIGRDLGVPVYPWYSKLEDPAKPGRMKPEWTIDGDHPSVTGYRRLADEVRLPSEPKTARRVSAAIQRALPTHLGFLDDDLCPALSDSVRTSGERRQVKRVQRATAREFRVLLGRLAVSPDAVVKVTSTPSDKPGVTVETMTVRELAEYHLSLFGVTREEAATPGGKCVLRYRLRLRKAL